MKRSFRVVFIHCIIAIATTYQTSASNSSGGYMLMMTSETQKKAERLVKSLDSDLEKLNNQLNSVLYERSRGKTLKRKNIRLTNETQQSLQKLTGEIEHEFDVLSDIFKSVYFVGGADDSYKKYFDSINHFRQDLKANHDSFEVAFLYSLHDQSDRVERNIKEVQQYIKYSKIETDSFINEKKNKMSVWEWLFGY